MAKFQLTNVELKTIAAGKQNAGKKFLSADLINMNCPWEAAQRYTCFLEPIVKIFEQLLPVAKGGTAQEEKPIPDNFQYISGCFAEYTPPQKFYKEHLSAHPATDKTPAIKVGDLLSKGGVPILYTTLRVFCQYYLDEEGNKQWMRGCSPEEAGQRAFAAYCRPVAEEKSTIVRAPSSEEARIMTEEKQAEAYAKLEDPNNQEKVIKGYDPTTGQPIYE